MSSHYSDYSVKKVIRNIQDTGGVARTLTANAMQSATHDNCILIIERAVAVAMRGRENGQCLEVSDREYANALTTVQKDSMVGLEFKDDRENAQDQEGNLSD